MCHTVQIVNLNTSKGYKPWFKPATDGFLALDRGVYVFITLDQALYIATELQRKAIKAKDDGNRNKEDALTAKLNDLRAAWISTERMRMA